MTLLYNFIMTALSVSGLWVLSKKPTVWRCCAVVASVGLAGAVGAMLLRFGVFGIFRLAAFTIFLHVPIILLGSSVCLWKSGRRWAIAAALAGTVVLAVAVDAFWIEPAWLEVSHNEMVSSRLKRPVRIVVVADLQTDEIGDYEREVFRRVREEKPDIVLFAGDYLQVPWTQWETVRDQLNDLLREADLASTAQVFVVRGNIDARREWPEIFNGLRFTVVDDTKTLNLDGLDLTCLHLEDSYSPRVEVRRPDTKRFHVVLGHVPNFALGAVDADLLIAGHTHGGQVRLPWFGPLVTHSRIPRHWAAGVTKLPSKARLVVSRGLGMEREHAPRMRFLCRPELVVIDLLPDVE